MDTHSLDRMCQKQFRKAMIVTPNILCLLVGRHNWWVNEYTSQIFGNKRVMQVESMSIATETIIKQFKALVLRVLR